MSNLPATRSNSVQITIKTADGQEIKIDPRQAVKTVQAPAQNSTYERSNSWQLAAGQPNDSRAGQMASRVYGKLFLYRNVPQDEGPAKTEVYILGETTQVWAIGTGRQRAAMPPGKYVAGQNRQPICRSASWFTPDETIYIQTDNPDQLPYRRLRGDLIPGTGIVADQCCTLKVKTDRAGNQILDGAGNPIIIEVDTCPLAQFTQMKDENGQVIKGPNGKPKWNPPQCRKDYVVAVVVPVIDSSDQKALEVAEIHFRSTVEKDGQNLIASINELEGRGLPSWTVPINLTWAPAGSGGVVQAALEADPEAVTVLSDEDTKLYQTLAAKFDQQLGDRIMAAQETLEDKIERRQQYEAERTAQAVAETMAEATPAQKPATKKAKGGKAIDAKAELI